MQTAVTFNPTLPRLIDAHERALKDWARLLEDRDLETHGHSFRVTGLAVRLARAMGLRDEALLNVRRGALLHDIGKLRIPEYILHKEGPLDKIEQAIVRRHPIDAYEMLREVSFLKQALDIPYCHHERWDGSGYPRGLKGEQIPLAARIFSVVDVFDALVNDRSYRMAMPLEDILLYLKHQRGKQFDPRVVDAFLNILGEE